MIRQDLLELAARNMRNARLRNALTTMESGSRDLPITSL
jgi:hypothetical protein